MASVAELFAHIPEWDPKEPLDAMIFIEPKDASPLPEISRQRAFLSVMATIAPAVDCLAIPNASKATDWERIQRWKEGARGGALDLIISWAPSSNSRGIFYAEFKNGRKMPTPAQRARLNMYHRQGHHCGVYRTADPLVAHLRDAGAPFIDRRWL